jgi:glycolate oxidase
MDTYQMKRFLYLRKLKKHLPNSVLTDTETLMSYSYDASSCQGALPVAVVRPKSVEECAKAVQIAHESGVAVVPRGAGTCTTGGAAPTRRAMILSFERMNKLIEIDSKNSIAVVEPGLINGHFQQALKPMNLFYPPDPASMAFCTLGGNVAENAGGPRGVKYGVTKDYVLGLEVVLPNGKTLTTGVRTHKGVVGYDLRGLIIGSEGTLGAITKIFFKLLPLPEKTMTLLAVFQSVQQAADTVSLITSSGLLPSTLEFMDRMAIEAVNRYKKTEFNLSGQAVLLIEVDGASPIVERDVEQIGALCASNQADVTIAHSVSERERLWQMRRAISPALYFISPSKINEDIVVPRTRLPEMLRQLNRIAEKYSLNIVNFGHAGDGNIHVNIMTNRSDPVEFARAEKAVRDIFEATLNLQGSISGEHGVGLTKRPYIDMEIPPHGLQLMRQIKELFDPKGIMNPDKIFP